MKSDIAKRIYELAEREIAHSDLNFNGHAVPVARMSRVYAGIFGADKDVCEYGGLLHDVGYTVDYNPEKADHIANGMVVALKILKESGAPEKYVFPIVDCIQTHDNHLNKNSLLENIIVHDVDLITAMDSLPTNLELMQRWGVSYGDALDKLELDIKKKREWIHHDLFKSLYEAKLPQFYANVNSLRKRK
jgi:putative nucleotidyltransferase with HDIG domain